MLDIDWSEVEKETGIFRTVLLVGDLACLTREVESGNPFTVLRIIEQERRGWCLCEFNDGVLAEFPANELTRITITAG